MRDCSCSCLLKDACFFQFVHFVLLPSTIPRSESIVKPDRKQHVAYVLAFIPLAPLCSFKTPCFFFIAFFALSFCLFIAHRHTHTNTKKISFTICSEQHFYSFFLYSPNDPKVNSDKSEKLRQFVSQKHTINTHCSLFTTAPSLFPTARMLFISFKSRTSLLLFFFFFSYSILEILFDFRLL